MYPDRDKAEEILRVAKRSIEEKDVDSINNDEYIMF